MREFIGSVSPKGQITLPMEIRRELGIKPKDKVAVTIDEESVKGIKGVRVTLVSARLAESFQAVPALKASLTLQEMTREATEEHALHVAREGL